MRPTRRARAARSGHYALVSEPILKQFGDLSRSDFELHPVWIGCHTADYEKPWYEDTDEETFRPRRGPLPADPSEGMLLLRAIATLRDATELPGFITPSFDGDLGIMQPHVFVGNNRFGFWGGSLGIPAEERNDFYAALRTNPTDVFPIVVAAEPGLVRGVVQVRIDGWPPKIELSSRRNGLRRLFRR
jgi:hypothetical protein